MRRWLLVLVVLMVVGPAVFAQTAAAVVADPPTANEFQGGLVWAFLCSSALEWVKRKPWLSALSVKTAYGVQRAVGIAVAIATAIGVHWSFDANAGALTITGLLVPSIWTVGVESLRQWCQQEVMYRVAVKNYGR